MTTMNREEQKQVLIDTANHIIHRDNTSPYSENLRELARIALAALEVEPIRFRCRRNDNIGDWSYVYHREPDDFERKHLVIEGIYAAPPAPVPLTEVQRAMLRDMDVEISAELEEEEEIYRDGIRKCIAALRYHHKRAETCSNGYTGSTLEEDTLKSINFLKRNNIAAMLQGAKPVSQTYKLNQLSGNSPVTPDGWISCSERMPEKNKNVLISVNFDSSLVEPLICSARYTGSTFRRGDVTVKPGNGIEQATHWMPLPEPPQEVNRG
ncbi:hypothetical protein A9R56_23865 [Escherichia coli]|uniref:DUF551 domain-containing protein n=1 Tax=Escherichia coli TaxID=562 RepID=UPI00084F9801|nr:hypothetical protein A9R56_23865 [Escherichia coli]